MIRKKIPNSTGIYCIKSKTNARKYIGSAILLKRRIYAEHKNSLIQGKHYNVHLQRHVNKYGIKDLEFFVLEICQKDNAIEKEQYWIDKLNPEFNICKDARSRTGTKLSEEQKEIMRERQKKRMSDPKLRERIRQATIQQFKDSQQRKRASEKAKLRMKREGNPMKGKKHSQETIEKIRQKKKESNSFKGKNNPNYGGKLLSGQNNPNYRKDFSGSNNPNYGNKYSEEVRRKMSEAKYNISDETRKRMSEAQKRRFGKIP